MASHELARMRKMDAYIAVRGSNNITELSDVPVKQMQLMAKKMRPVQDQRVKKTKWVVLRWPTPSMAQLAGMSTEAFEDFYFEVCTLDYRKLQPGMKALKALMERTDRVEIKGAGTDVRFSIKGIPAVICGGDRNIPDGEVFSCPVKNSVQGCVSFNAPSIYQSTGFDGIRLEFRDGKIVDATSNQTEKLNKILDSDAGARYLGEFSLGFNPHVLQPIETYLTQDQRNTVIVYSLGNFLSNQSRTYVQGLMPDQNGDPRDSLIVKFAVVKRDYGPAGTRVELADVGILPVWTENNHLQLKSGQVKGAMIAPMLMDREIPRLQARLDELEHLGQLTNEQKQEVVKLSSRLELLKHRREILLARTGDEYLVPPPKLP